MTRNPPGLSSGRLPRPRGGLRLPHPVDRTSERTVTWEDGRTYPVVDVEISSVSPPFYTGQARVLDTAGRVEQFRRRYGSSQGRLTTSGNCSRPAITGRPTLNRAARSRVLIVRSTQAAIPVIPAAC